MEGIILYKSQYGSTAQYASWLGSDLGLPVKNLDETSGSDFIDRNFVIIGSNIKVGKIKAAPWIKSNWQDLEDKKVIVFAVCGSYADKEEQQKVLETNFPEHIRRNIEYYPLPGRLDKAHLNWWDSFIVYLGSKFLPDKEAAERMKTGFDWVEEENLDSIIASVDEYCGEVRMWKEGMVG